MEFPGLRIGIELEVLLTPISQSQRGFESLEHFARFITKKWNAERPPSAAKMHTDVDGLYEGGNADSEWTITDDSTILDLEDAGAGRCK